MIHQLHELVFFGDGNSPFEVKDCMKAILNVAHHFRKEYSYFERMKSLPHEILFFRLARKDRQDVDDAYMESLTDVVNICKRMNAFPILTHCQRGAHRGPASAIFTAWHLSGRSLTSLQELNLKAQTFVPTLKPGHPKIYYTTMLKWCEAHSV